MNTFMLSLDDLLSLFLLLFMVHGIYLILFVWSINSVAFIIHSGSCRFYVVTEFLKIFCVMKKKRKKLPFPKTQKKKKTTGRMEEDTCFLEGMLSVRE